MSVVQCFQFSQLFNVLFDQVSNAPQKLATLARGHLAPWAARVIKRFPRRRHRLVNAARSAFGHLRQHLSRCRIEGVERFSRSRPFAVDEQFAGRNFCFCRCDHIQPLAASHWLLACFPKFREQPSTLTRMFPRIRVSEDALL